MVVVEYLPCMPGALGSNPRTDPLMQQWMLCLGWTDLTCVSPLIAWVESDQVNITIEKQTDIMRHPDVEV
jgi:hypothetical protein